MAAEQNMMQTTTQAAKVAIMAVKETGNPVNTWNRWPSTKTVNI